MYFQANKEKSEENKEKTKINTLRNEKCGHNKYKEKMSIEN